MCCCKCCSRGFEKFLVWILEKRNPGLGVREILRLLDMIRERLSDEDEQRLKGPNSEETDGAEFSQLSLEENGDRVWVGKEKTEVAAYDGKWRPLMFTLGLLYKLQRTQDDSWYDNADVFVTEEEKRKGLVEVFGYFWHYLFNVSWAMVFKKKDEEVLRTTVAESMKVKEGDIVKIHVKDAENIEDHAPDTTLVLHHDRKEIVMCICGTKITPAPSLGDIMIDLHADSADHLSGRAHQGMAIASKNILEIFESDLVEAIRLNPGYRVLVIGYSLGAGVSQLLTLELLQEGRLPEKTQIYCIAYGPPPVFKSDAIFYSHPNIFTVLHHNDGLATLSLHTLTKLFLQVKAVEGLNIPRCKIMALLRRKLIREEVDATGTRKHVSNVEEMQKDEWCKILARLDSVSTSGFDELDLVGGNLFMVKQREEKGEDERKYTVRHLSGLSELRNLSSCLKLRTDCFNDHMPWGYNGLFKKAGKETCDVGVLDEFIPDNH